MFDIRLFLSVNKLKQKEVADYLSVTETAISNAVNGKSELSKANLIKLRQNNKGWDISMISDEEIAEKPLQQFISKNSIKQNDLAKYLGLSKAYMSQIVSGASKLADSRYQMLIDNPYGWDTSMLSRETKSDPAARTTQPAAIRIDTDTELQHALDMIDLYKEMLDDLRKQIDFLQRMLERTSSTG